MPLQTSPPTDQRAGVRPIAFLMDAFGALSSPVYLQIRPEDLTLTVPARTAVHQTLGRETIGWVDNFGQGLPQINISGHTGWRTSSFSGLDGASAFDELNFLINESYPRQKQIAIDAGFDPGFVRLIFTDSLDGFSYAVAPMQFVLRRSKSRPLLFQYQMQLQAEGGPAPPLPIDLPNPGNPSNGLLRLNEIRSNGLLDKAKELFPTMSKLVDLLKSAIDKVLAFVGQVTKFVNDVVALARQVAQAAMNCARILAAVINAPFELIASIKAAARQIISMFHEVVCLFSNALRPRKIYDSYDGVFGASNCSSTVGGRPPSAFSDTNLFSQIFDGSGQSPVVTTTGSAAISKLANMDAVLEPPTPDEVNAQLLIVSENVL